MGEILVTSALLLDKRSFLIRGRRGFATLTEEYPRRFVEFILN
jgi:hypothetical protein